MGRRFALAQLIIMLIVMVMVMCPVPTLAEGMGDAVPIQIDLTPMLQALIGLLATIITVKVVPWIKSKTTAEQQENLRTATRILVYAAEQTYKAGHGEEKLEHVKAGLEKKGLTVDVDAIEAAVREMNISDWFLSRTEPPTDPDTPA